MRPHVIVVEGRNDASRIKKLFPDIDIVVTHGSAIALDALTLLDKFDQTHDIVLFLDPDHAGDRIRRILSNRLTHVFHAFIDKEEAVSKNHKKIGVEHASDERIKEALSHLKISNKQSKTDLTMSFLYDLKLIGHPESTRKRKSLSMMLHIGYVNGKTLLNRLVMFGYQQKDVIEVLNESSTQEEVRTELPKG